MKRDRLLAASAALNVLLVVAVVLVWMLGRSSPPASGKPASTDELCAEARKDVAFFIEGLQKGQEAYYTPLAGRTLEPVVLHCRPRAAQHVRATFKQLRDQLLLLLVANKTSPREDRQKYIDAAIRLFTEIGEILDEHE